MLKVAAGGSGSGGEVTLRNILANAPEWKRLVDILPDGSETALNKLRDRQIDAFFVMDGPQSPLLQDVRDTVDPKTKERVFKFADLRPERQAVRHPLQQPQPLRDRDAAVRLVQRDEDDLDARGASRSATISTGPIPK